MFTENVLEKVGRFQCHRRHAKNQISSCHSEVSDQQQDVKKGDPEGVQRKGLYGIYFFYTEFRLITIRLCNLCNLFLILFQDGTYDQLFYFETSPTFCSVTRGRRCLHPDNCATLCCGRGYTTKVVKTIEKCRCRFTNGRCCQIVCDYCEKYEDRYYCK